MPVFFVYMIPPLAAYINPFFSLYLSRRRRCAMPLSLINSYYYVISLALIISMSHSGNLISALPRIQPICRLLIPSNSLQPLAVLPFLPPTSLNSLTPFHSFTAPFRIPSIHVPYLAARHGNPINHPKPSLPAFGADPA